jgi:hypothetical protein
MVGLPSDSEDGGDKYSAFECHTYNEVRLSVLGIRKKEVGNTIR